jgi:hypothetical protein
VVEEKLFAVDDSPNEVLVSFLEPVGPLHEIL